MSRRFRSRTPATHSPNQAKLPSARGDCEAHLSTAAAASSSSSRARSQLLAPAPQQQLVATFLTAARQRYETAKWTLSPVKSSRAISRLSTPPVMNAAAAPRLQALTLGTTRGGRPADGVGAQRRHLARLPAAGGLLLLKDAGKLEPLSRATGARLARPEGFSHRASAGDRSGQAACGTHATQGTRVFWRHRQHGAGRPLPPAPGATHGAQPRARRPSEGHQGAMPAPHRGGKALEGRSRAAPGRTRPGRRGCLTLGLPASKRRGGRPLRPGAPPPRSP